MEISIFLIFLFSVFLLVGCAGNGKQVQTQDTVVAGDSVSDDLNIKSIDSASSDDAEIDSANLQVDEVSSVLDAW